MLNFIYSISSLVSRKKNTNKFLYICYVSLYLFLSRFVNLCMPTIYKFTKKKSKRESTHKEPAKPRVIVSLTSFPARIDNLWMCIESLLSQTIQPDMIILWLAESQFSGKESLPRKLLEQENRGLIIKFCDDLKSHKKYYYSFQEFPNDIIITVDDDVYYPTFTLEKLIELHEKFPQYICCNRGHYMTFNRKEELMSYNEWTTINTSNKNSGKLLCPTGVGGVLYPPNVMDKEVLNKNSIKKLSFYADDLWLKVMSLLNGTMVVKTNDFPEPLFTIKSSQIDSLGKSNVINGENDKQLEAILTYYSINLTDLI